MRHHWLPVLSPTNSTNSFKICSWHRLSIVVSTSLGNLTIIFNIFSPGKEFKISNKYWTNAFLEKWFICKMGNAYLHKIGLCLLSISSFHPRGPKSQRLKKRSISMLLWTKYTTAIKLLFDHCLSSALKNNTEKECRNLPKCEVGRHFLRGEM